MIRLVLILCLLPLTLRAATASWYGEEHRGDPRADGKPFDPDSLICASRVYPRGTILEIRHGRRRVIVIVADYGPAKWVKGVDIDLSRRAFELLAPLGQGRITVEIHVLKPAP